MNNTGPLTPPRNSSKKTQQTANPFARALAESEKRTFAGNNKDQNSSDNNLFGESLARTGGQIPQAQEQSPQDLLAQQEELKKERLKAEQRKKLHDQINPVGQAEIFNANRERTKKELEEVRKELKALATEIRKFYKEVDIQTTQSVVDQGSTGAGLMSFFQKLRATIKLLTQQVRSARTWMNQHNAKQKKKKGRKIRGGIDARGGGKTEESKAVFDMMHHERSTAYSGA